MIDVRILPNGVEISGHSGLAPAGQDLLCAAVSGLTYAIIAALDKKGQINTCEMRPGYALVTTFDHNNPYLDVAEAGLEYFARQYPGNIKYFSCREGREKTASLLL